MTVKVYYEDTDAVGVVYYANYLRFMERCRTDWLHNLGYDVHAMTQQYGVLFAVRSASIDYLKPARLSDILTITVNLTGLRRVSLDVAQDVYRGEELLCRGRVRLASLRSDTFDPSAIPAPILTEIEKWKMP